MIFYKNTKHNDQETEAHQVLDIYSKAVVQHGNIGILDKIP